MSVSLHTTVKPLDFSALYNLFDFHFFQFETTPAWISRNDAGSKSWRHIVDCKILNDAVSDFGAVYHSCSDTVALCSAWCIQVFFNISVQKSSK